MILKIYTGKDKTIRTCTLASEAKLNNYALTHLNLTFCLGLTSVNRSDKVPSGVPSQQRLAWDMHLCNYP